MAAFFYISAVVQVGCNHLEPGTSFDDSGGLEGPPHFHQRDR
jgi:hypothetical protein